jgi:hypothetical protein
MKTFPVLLCFTLHILIRRDKYSDKRDLASNTGFSVYIFEACRVQQPKMELPKIIKTDKFYKRNEPG